MSFGRTAIRYWITAGPASRSAVTKCTVAPCVRSPLVEHALVRVEARVFRQQRRMDVEHSPREARDELRREDAHEAGEHDEIRRVLRELGRERLVVNGALGAALRRQMHGRNARHFARARVRAPRRGC